MTQSNPPRSPLKQYKFCPKCGGDFNYQGGNHLKCQQCSHSYFVNQAPTVGIVILNDRNEVMLAKRKFEPNKGSWQTIGGFIDLDESLEEALMREAREELGVTIKVQHYLGSFPENYEYGGATVPFLAMFFVADIAGGQPKAADDVEEIQYYSVSDLKDLNITYPKLRTMLIEYMNIATGPNAVEDTV